MTIHPDDMSRGYARILPAIRRLGYHSDIRPGHASDGYRFRLDVGRHETAYVDLHGAWSRGDGETGSDPDSLLAAYRHDRLTEARHHLAADDRKALARDLLELSHGIPVSVILDVRPDDASWNVDYRPQGGPPETITLAQPRQTLAETISRLGESWTL